jgi:hypothetical protein
MTWIRLSRNMGKDNGPNLRGIPAAAQSQDSDRSRPALMEKEENGRIRNNMFIHNRETLIGKQVILTLGRKNYNESC